MTGLSFLYSANGDSPPDPNIEISGEVLIVQGLEITTIEYFGAVPVSMPAVEPVGSSIQETMSKMEIIAATFQAAYKLAMSDSEGMPHNHKFLDIRREELARTLLCNHEPHTPNGRARPPSKESIQGVSEAITSVNSAASLLENITDFNTIGGVQKGPFLSIVIMNLRAYRFCVSSVGSFLMVPSSTPKGDIVCVLFGCDMPVVLRKKAKNRYGFVGACYAHGVMQGEAMRDLADGKYTATEFLIH